MYCPGLTISVQVTALTYGQVILITQIDTWSRKETHLPLDSMVLYIAPKPLNGHLQLEAALPSKVHTQMIPFSFKL